jgi:flagellar biosynthesis/type III secretory pathway chaperone
MSVMTLDRYRATLKRLATVIGDERAAIESSDAPRIETTCTDKSKALKELSELLVQIRDGRIRLRDAERQEFSELLRQCMDANLANGALINARKARVHSRLAPLINDSPTYDPRKAFNGSFSSRLFARV